jgi:hypothetical protein
MSFVNEKPATSSRRPLWKRAAVIAIGTGATALLVLTFFPPAFESLRYLSTQPIASAFASGAQESAASVQIRGRQIAQAQTVAHGSFVKDPYGCVYVFQYIAARLILEPVLDAYKQPVCKR